MSTTLSTSVDTSTHPPQQVAQATPISRPGRHRVRLLAQSGKDFDLSGYVRFWLGSAEKVTGNLRVQVDIDPMSFM